MNRRSEYKKIALEAVQKAGTIITDYFHHLPKVETKPDHTPVTKADKEAEEIIVSTISKAFPNHGFIGEEFGTENENAEFTWIIDPIDGTKTFIRGMPFFGTVLGLRHQNKIILGISHMPILNELLYASDEEPTTLNGKPVRVSKIEKLKDSYVNVNPSNLANTNLTNILRALDTKVLNIRGFGDLYGYHLVANGRADAFLEIGPSAWDISAFQIIIKQAGGEYSDFDGNEYALGGTSLATNGLLHQQLLSFIQSS
ncbi:inositol monophosphatase [Candidatus Woesebacteria bacterium]|nr:inositol monophosphatase [Candidatus Woesebacteria bacterium]